MVASVGARDSQGVVTRAWLRGFNGSLIRRLIVFVSYSPLNDLDKGGD